MAIAVLERFQPLRPISLSLSIVIPSKARDLGSSLRNLNPRRRQTHRSLASLGMTIHLMTICFWSLAIDSKPLLSRFRHKAERLRLIPLPR